MLYYFPNYKLFSAVFSLKHMMYYMEINIMEYVSVSS